MMAQNPAAPSFIFRGHASAIHALHFFSSNSLLASGDSHGWIVVWSVATKRPVAVWKGHDGGIMAIRHWGGDRLMSHGRDHILRVWQLRSHDFDSLSVTLPVDGAHADANKQPWLLHSMAANALNYCAFSMCEDNCVDRNTVPDDYGPLLIATPNGLDPGGVDIFQLPTQQRVNQISSTKSISTGMVMALSLFEHPDRRQLTLVSGFESGHIIVQTRTNAEMGDWRWQSLMTCRPHSQPVLSIDTTLDCRCFISSSADAIITEFAVPTEFITDPTVARSTKTNHAGQQDLTIRDDGRIFATAGWDKRVRVYSVKTLKELAVLKWHQEGCYAITFAQTRPATDSTINRDSNREALSQTTVDLIKDERARKAQNIHWLAAGGKDGKVSLWDIY